MVNYVIVLNKNPDNRSCILYGREVYLRLIYHHNSSPNPKTLKPEASSPNPLNPLILNPYPSAVPGSGSSARSWLTLAPTSVVAGVQGTNKGTVPIRFPVSVL